MPCGKKRVSVNGRGSTNGERNIWFMYGSSGLPKWRYINSHQGPPTSAPATRPPRTNAPTPDSRDPPAWRGQHRNRPGEAVRHGGEFQAAGDAEQNSGQEHAPAGDGTVAGQQQQAR